MNKLNNLVYKLIKQKPWLANDDAALVAAVWRKQGWDDSVSLEDNIAKVSRSESITRRRRELHEKGLIKYSDKAFESRHKAFLNERDSHSNFKVSV